MYPGPGVDTRLCLATHGPVTVRREDGKGLRLATEDQEWSLDIMDKACFLIIYIYIYRRKQSVLCFLTEMERS